MKILFRKILNYDIRKDKSDAFIYASLVLSQRINPNSIKKRSFQPLTEVVFCSELRRASQCIKRNKDFRLIFTKFLNEIPFVLKKHCSKLEYKREGSVAVRRLFKKLFIEDKLLISRKILFKEIETLFRHIKTDFDSEKSITIISHSFRMKCIEAYLKTNGRVAQFPELIHDYINDNEKTFDFGQGFDFDI